MSKVYFQIGYNNFVQISLPSKMNDDGDWFVGKAKVRADSLSCSHYVRIHKEHLALFFADVSRAYETLKGEFVLQSSSPGFVLRGEMTRKGQVRIWVRVGFEVRNEIPDYTEWQAEAIFNFEPEGLKKILENQIS